MCVFPLLFFFFFIWLHTFQEQPRRLQGRDPFSQMFHSPVQGLGHNYTATLQIHRNMSECGENASPPVWLDMCRVLAQTACHMVREAFLKKPCLLLQSHSVWGATLRPHGRQQTKQWCLTYSRRLPSEWANGCVVFSCNRCSVP